MEQIRLGNIYGATGGSFAGMVYSSDGLAPSLTTMEGGGREPHIVECVAMRGREDGQQHELNGIGCSNTITTVQKDNLILELDKISETEKALRAEQSRAEQLNLCKTSDKGRDDTNENRRCCGSELSVKQNTQRSSNRERRCLSDSDNGECPQCA